MKNGAGQYWNNWQKCQESLNTIYSLYASDTRSPRAQFHAILVLMGNKLQASSNGCFVIKSKIMCMDIKHFLNPERNSSVLALCHRNQRGITEDLAERIVSGEIQVMGEFSLLIDAPRIVNDHKSIIIMSASIAHRVKNEKLCEEVECKLHNL